MYVDERETLGRIWRRIVPLLALILFLNYLDKVNIGFASLQMNQDLALSNTTFGLAAGLFAIGYALAAIPSTLLMQRFGARRWITVVMVIWGLCSASTALVSSPSELYLARVALGAAEAGFTPGVIFYLSSWFPSAYRGRVFGTFLIILPIALVVGGPLSSMLLSLTGLLGLTGWQWLFLVEGLPSASLAGLVFFFLADSPETARWLSAREREWLTKELAAEDSLISSSQPRTQVRHALARPRVVILALAFHGIAASGTGAIIFLPLVIRAMGFSTQLTGLVAALPALISALSLPFWGLWSDRAHNRSLVVVASCLAIAAGLLGTAALFPSTLALFPLTVALVGFFGSVAPFWTLPSSFLTGAAAAAGIAAINVAGNLGSFSGPALLGWLSDHLRSYAAGLVGMSMLAAVAAVLMIAQAGLGAMPHQPAQSS